MPSAASTPLLAATDLGLSRGGRELFQNVSFAISPGELWQIDGANGAGKTSLIRILCGLSRYGFEGEVQRNAQSLYLGHQAAVKAQLTPRENLQMHVSGESDYSTTDIEAALASVGLYGYEDVPSHTLSAGQHRQVNLARLYLSTAPLWLLDEPFTAIDAAGVEGLQRLLETHLARKGAVMLISHQALAVNCPVRHLTLTGVLPR